MRIIYRIQSAIAAMLVAAIVATPLAHAQQPQQSPASVSPEVEAQQLLQQAHTIAIVDVSQPFGWSEAEVNATPLLQAAMRAWGQFKITRDPSKADVVFEISPTRQPYTYYSPHGVAYHGHNPYLQLTVVDPKTEDPLWSITVPALTGYDHTRDLFAMSIGNVVSQVKLLDGVALTPQETSDLGYLDRKIAHDRKVARTAGFIVIGVFVAATVGGIVAFRHSVDNAKKAQEQFCQENHMPNCAV
ncbi:hypothetical protein ACFQBQ_15560 [Granulicella cerasi]|uniref:Uncharacterized protein n=1 Tax=Granulicella cerasi TaxID=741063 RepID=A0ABW1ZC30_9BACT|nr:hypothetical protein [Granulicella cerasi]